VPQLHLLDKLRQPVQTFVGTLVNDKVADIVSLALDDNLLHGLFSLLPTARPAYCLVFHVAGERQRDEIAQLHNIVEEGLLL